MQSFLYFWLSLCTAFAVLCILLLRVDNPFGELTVHFLDVGQGDSALLVTPTGKRIVIDGGPDLSLLTHLSEYFPFFERNIDLLVLSHPDRDHIAALPELLRRYDVDLVLLPAAKQNSGIYSAFLSAITEQGSRVIVTDPTIDIVLGDGVVLDIVSPKDVSSATSNNTSVTLRVLYGKESILFTGDIEEDMESVILGTGVDVSSTIIKVPHHGSRTSSSTGFLLAVNPRLGIISAGEENRFGHPHTNIVKRYKKLDIALYSTIGSGTISLQFAGK